jgi:hypothetical protein
MQFPGHYEVPNSHKRIVLYAYPFYMHVPIVGRRVLSMLLRSILVPIVLKPHLISFLFHY